MCLSVFSLNPDGASKVVWTSGVKRTWALHLNIKHDHLSLAIDLVTYAKTCTCMTCSRVFRRKHAAITHTCLAGDPAQFRFAGELFVHTKTIFDKIEVMGVCAAEGKRYYPYRIMCDIDMYTDAEDTPQCSYEAMQRLMSISICSNVPGFMDPTCFVSSEDIRGMSLGGLLVTAC